MQDPTPTNNKNVKYLKSLLDPLTKKDKTFVSSFSCVNTFFRSYTIEHTTYLHLHDDITDDVLIGIIDDYKEYLKDLRIDRCNQITAKGLSALSELTLLEKLSLNKIMIKEVHFTAEELANSISQLTKLQSLQLNNVSGMSDDVLLLLLSNLKDLESLSLRNWETITHKGLEGLNQLKSLKKLDLSGALSLSGMDIESALLHISKQTYLIELNLDSFDNWSAVNNENLSTLDTLSQLETLTIPYQYRNSEESLAIFNLGKALSCLKKLKVNFNCTKTDINFLETFKGLEALTLSKFNIERHPDLTVLTNLKAIKYLEFEDCDFSDDGLRQLAESDLASQLTTLRFHKLCRIDVELTAEGIKENLLSFSSLKHLTLPENILLNNALYETIQLLPKLKSVNEKQGVQLRFKNLLDDLYFKCIEEESEENLLSTFMARAQSLLKTIQNAFISTFEKQQIVADLFKEIIHFYSPHLRFSERLRSDVVMSLVDAVSDVDPNYLIGILCLSAYQPNFQLYFHILSKHENLREEYAQLKKFVGFEQKFLRKYAIKGVSFLFSTPDLSTSRSFLLLLPLDLLTLDQFDQALKEIESPLDLFETIPGEYQHEFDLLLLYALYRASIENECSALTSFYFNLLCTIEDGALTPEKSVEIKESFSEFETMLEEEEGAVASIIEVYTEKEEASFSWCEKKILELISEQQKEQPISSPSIF